MTLEDFCAAHPVPVPGAPPVRSFLTELASGPSSVLALSDGDGLALVATLVDACTNAAGTTEVVVHGLRRDGGEGPRLEAALAWAKARAREAGFPGVDAQGPEGGPFTGAQLAAAGFAEAYRMYAMERRGGPAPAAPPPPGLRFEACAPDHVPSFHEATRLAFADVPGAFVSSLATFAAQVAARPIPPRLLLDGDRVIGFTRVEVAADGSGIVHTLGRHPDARGRGLGPVLLAEALRVLGEARAAPIRLEVAARNDRALALYRSAGFELIGAQAAYRAVL